MTPTATKPTSPIAQLAKLERERDELHAIVREAQRKRDAWDAETRAMQAACTQHRLDYPEQYAGGDMRPRPDTEAHKLATKTRARLAERANPHLPEYEAAVVDFQAASQVEQDFRHDRVDDLMAELHPEVDAAVAEMREGWELVRRGAARYRAGRENARSVVIGTPGLDGQDFGYDPTPDAWHDFARDALEHEIVKPCLSELGRWKLAQHE